VVNPPMHKHDSKFWDKAQETMKPEERANKILARIKHQLNYVYDRSSFIAGYTIPGASSRKW
jgi:hypothetical protein